MLKNIYLVIVLMSIVLILTSCLLYKYNISEVSNDSTLKEFKVEAGETYLSIATNLKNSNLIKSELFYKIYIKIFNPEQLEAGTYELAENMKVEDIVDVLESGSNYSNEVINITFKEGLNMRSIAKIISSNTSNSESDVYATLEDEKYLDELINNYWFITNEIKDKDIYYSLEGYLYPDTYQFSGANATVKEIFNTMLDKMDSVLTSYKSDIEKSKYTVHEILTLASIVELEAANSSDRKGVAGVFYNRLENNWSLGSDVTTYYAEKVDLSERDLYQSEFDAYNAYNTRSSKMAGKLPVSPICNPSLNSIESAINPTKHNYFYFVADKNKKTYFNTNENGHTQTISKLKSEGLWFEY